MKDSLTPSAIRLVLFDLAGTTVKDGGSGGSPVVQALLEALEEAGHVVGGEAVTAHRGKRKIETIRLILRDRAIEVSEEEVDAIHRRFLGGLLSRMDQFTEMPGASETFRFLRSRGIRIGVGSGFPLEIVQEVVSRLKWMDQGLLDYVGSAETLGAGRPDPAMIHDAMTRFGISDSLEVMKVGDTVADVEEGKNAGAWTVAVLSGTQPEISLRGANPEFVLESVADLPGLLSDPGSE